MFMWTLDFLMSKYILNYERRLLVYFLKQKMLNENFVNALDWQLKTKGFFLFSVLEVFQFEKLCL